MGGGSRRLSQPGATPRWIGQSVSAAESVTAGHIQAALSLADNARQFFQGGITVYNLGQKTRHLGIEPIHALTCNGVSEIVSGQMALAAARMFISNYGIGITGYAAPVPEKNIHQPYAYFSLCHDGKLLSTVKVEAPSLSALETQLFYANEVLAGLASALRRI